MRPTILILGPTAGGKTTLSIELANQLLGGGECIIADSMQVYTDMNIGTAKPTQEELSAAPHHLVNLVPVDSEGFTVNSWLEASEQSIEEIQSRNKYPIIVGGTNLYIQAFLFGLFEGPQSNEQIRESLAGLKNSELFERLQKVDPLSVERININDRKRLIRALEVFELTGQPISELQNQWQGRPPREDVIIVGLDWAVSTINKRINKRVKLMMDNGLLEEVSSLRGKFNSQASEALGYKQILSHLAGECTLDEAVERIKILTRRYAKQQRTWLKRFKVLPNTHFIEMGDKNMQVAVNEALTHIQSHLPLNE